MSTYRVNLVNVGSFTVEVQADNEEDAFDLAVEMAPLENIHTGYDMGEWTIASKIWPYMTDPAEDIEILEGHSDDD